MCVSDDQPYSLWNVFVCWYLVVHIVSIEVICIWLNVSACNANRMCKSIAIR